MCISKCIVHANIVFLFFCFWLSYIKLLLVFSSFMLKVRCVFTNYSSDLTLLFLLSIILKINLLALTIYRMSGGEALKALEILENAESNSGVVNE